MAYDAGMLRFVIAEINEKLTGGKVEKIYQPTRDEVVLIIRRGGSEYRLDISAGGNGSHMNITALKPENPANPPMFCMMLRKHFQGAKFLGADQLGFERAARLTFDAHDDMGFSTKKHIICELIGRFANIIITNAEDKIIGVLKSVDFSTSEKRQVLCGMKYEEPPKQDKLDPMSDEVNERFFCMLAANSEADKSAEKFIMSNFSGISPLIAREIVYRAAGRVDATLKESEKELTALFFEMINKIKSCTGKPVLVKNSDGVPIEYAFCDIKQYGAEADTVECASFGELIDRYFGERSREERIRRKASDIFKLLTNAEARIKKKISLQEEELAACADGDKYKLYGDIIISNIYAIKKGDEECEFPNYFSDECENVKVRLNKRLSPSANAQAYFKKYNKSKAAFVHLTEQIENSKRELEYIYTVLDALTRAEGEKELSEIRSELYHSGYASKIKNYAEKKQSAPSISKYVTTDGYTVLCGRNNTANDQLTTKLADRGDWWFHVKNQPGSHVILQCREKGEEPPERAFTEAAEIAAYNSKAKNGVMTPVDYTKVGKVKKPQGSKPGFVVYSTNWTAYVTPDAEKINSMKRT